MVFDDEEEPLNLRRESPNTTHIHVVSPGVKLWKHCEGDHNYCPNHSPEIGDQASCKVWNFHYEEIKELTF